MFLYDVEIHIFCCKPRSTYLMTKYLMIRKALQVSKQNHKTKVPHLYNLNNIIAFLVIANTRQIPLYQFMICCTQNFISITVNLYKGLKIGLLLFNSNVQVLLLLLPVVAAASFGLTIFRFEPYVLNIVFHRLLQRLDSMYYNEENID